MNIAVSLNPAQITVAAFEALCAQHKWGWQFSDDHRTWMQGSRVEREIDHQLAQNTELHAVYLKYCPAPQSLRETESAYRAWRDTAIKAIGPHAVKKWETETNLPVIYSSLPRDKKGWWWLCEIVSLVKRETGDQTPSIYTHMI